ncbi:transcriptional regulator, ArsR family [Roseovarius marisflavi]|uniref:Transcriptional regulator, ArsR family n=1 Tax=Roseovarius marisflavi TaxID=1054996 RepID=A0A1M6W9L8_9RHOB|nr:helix-turn-helix domain-containing protein [Roseovarius marisflavi]SHK90453.1 transcriptional regulator, ArsR family [Roseovarius marisflavi]
MSEIAKALSSERRQQILRWLVDPVANFPAQHTGDLEKDGVCVGYIADKLGIAQPSATSQMKILQEAGLVQSTRIAQWTFYRRDEAGIAKARSELTALLD